MPKSVSFAPHNDVVFMGDKPGKAPFRREATPFPTKDDLAPRDRIGSDDSTATNLLFEDPHSDPFIDNLHNSDSDLMLSFGGNEKRLRQDDAENSDPQQQQQLMPPPPAKKFAAGAEEQQPFLETDGAQDDKDNQDEDAPASDEEGGSNDDENEAALQEWNSVIDEILNEDPSSPYRQRLEVFLTSLQKRQDEQEKLNQLYEETKKAYEKNTESTIKLIVPLHSEIEDSLHILEQDLLLHFGGNHKLRQDVIAKLEATNTRWQQQYEAFYARSTQRTPVPDDPVSEEDTAENAGATAAAAAAEEEDAAAATATKKSTSSDNDATMADASQDDGAPEPDWDAIIELDPSSRDAIDAFRKGRDHWQAVLDDFEKMLDGVYDELKENTAAILQTFKQAYAQIAGELDELQYDIQHYIVANFQKRGELKYTLVEAKTNHDSIFQRFMQRVKGASSSSSTTTTAAAAAGTTTASNAPQHAPQGDTTTCGRGFSFGKRFLGSKRK